MSESWRPVRSVEERSVITADTEAEIHRLHHAENWPPGTIARQLRIHVDVVRRVLGVQQPSTCAQRGSFVDAYVPFIKETLEQWPTLRSTRIHDMLRERGFPGSPRTVREHVAQLRPRKQREAFLRTSPLIGEQSQIDWAFIGNVDVDGTKRALWMFVIVLSWSRAIWAESCFAIDAPAVARSLVRAGTAFGGVTRQWLFDNPKTIVIERVSADLVRFHPLLLATTTQIGEARHEAAEGHAVTPGAVAAHHLVNIEPGVRSDVVEVGAVVAAVAHRHLDHAALAGGQGARSQCTEKRAHHVDVNVGGVHHLQRRVRGLRSDEPDRGHVEQRAPQPEHGVAGELGEQHQQGVVAAVDDLHAAHPSDHAFLPGPGGAAMLVTCRVG